MRPDDLNGKTYGGERGRPDRAQCPPKPPPLVFAGLASATSSLSIHFQDFGCHQLEGHASSFGRAEPVYELAEVIVRRWPGGRTVVRSIPPPSRSLGARSSVPGSILDAIGCLRCSDVDCGRCPGCGRADEAPRRCGVVRGELSFRVSQAARMLAFSPVESSSFSRLLLGWYLIGLRSVGVLLARAGWGGCDKKANQRS